MRDSVLSVILGLIALIFATTTFVYKHQVGILKFQLTNSHQRVKRDVMVDANDGEYFPLYTQLSAKSIQRICNRQWHISKNRTKMKQKKKPIHKRKCPQINKISIELSWNRPFSVGSASKCGQNWLITEYSSGYTLFEYNIADKSTLIHTLPEAFEGTDHTAYCDNKNKFFIYYSQNFGWNSGSIVKFDLKTKKHVRVELIALENPLYNGSSSVDLEIYDNFIWAIYRLPSDQKMAITKFGLDNLKKAGGWMLDDSRLFNASNCFISCSILYSTNSANSINGMQKIEAVYNFETNDYLSSKGLEWKSDGKIQNLHYDQNEDALNVFENGSIYTIKLYRD